MTKTTTLGVVQIPESVSPKALCLSELALARDEAIRASKQATEQFEYELIGHLRRYNSMVDQLAPKLQGRAGGLGIDFDFQRLKVYASDFRRSDSVRLERGELRLMVTSDGPKFGTRLPLEMLTGPDRGVARHIRDRFDRMLGKQIADRAAGAKKRQAELRAMIDSAEKEIAAVSALVYVSEAADD